MRDRGRELEPRSLSCPSELNDLSERCLGALASRGRTLRRSRQVHLSPRLPMKREETHRRKRRPCRCRR